MELKSLASFTPVETYAISDTNMDMAKEQKRFEIERTAPAQGTPY